MNGTHRVVIARMHDGLGNQLFEYAAARHIAQMRGAELLLDTVSGFARDRKYGATSQLAHFPVKARIAPARLCYPPPFGRQIRDLQIALSKHLPLGLRFVVREADFEAICAGAALRRLVRVEGYWQSERYFRPIADEIASELTPARALSARSAEVLAQIRSTASICLHVRQMHGAHHNFDRPPPSTTPQLPFSYYEEAVAGIAARVQNPVFFVFADKFEWIRARWDFPYPVHFVDHNRSAEGAVEDLALMAQCRHFVAGNSTFSWWGAWLARAPGKIVYAPANKGRFRWSSEPDVIPARWNALEVAGA